MTAGTKQKQEVGGSFFYVQAVDNLLLSGKTKRLEVGECTIATRRSMMHLVRSAAKWSELPKGWAESSALDSETFIATACKGKPSAILPAAEQRCREALWVLAGTMLYFSPRSKVRSFGLRGDVSTFSSEATLLCTNRRGFHQNWEHRGSLIPQALESRWWRYFKQRKLAKFLSFTNDPGISKKWKQTLWRSASLVGRSRQSESRAEAFLYQMFALEALVLTRGDPQRSTLAKRLCGLLYGHADTAEIEWLYGIRCEVVHDGNYSAVTPEALHAADYYALNTVWNAATQRRHWSNKQEFKCYCSRKFESKRPPSARMGLRVTYKRFNSKDYALRLP